MSYPMTFERFVRRADGIDEEGKLRKYVDMNCRLCAVYGISGQHAGVHHRAHNLGGDLRRLIADALDDRAYQELVSNYGNAAPIIRLAFERFFGVFLATPPFQEPKPITGGQLPERI